MKCPQPDWLKPHVPCPSAVIPLVGVERLCVVPVKLPAMLKRYKRALPPEMGILFATSTWDSNRIIKTPRKLKEAEVRLVGYRLCELPVTTMAEPVIVCLQTFVEHSRESDFWVV